MAASNFWCEVYFLPSKIFLETREEKSNRGLDQEIMVNVRKHIPPLLSETMSHVRSCDLRHCHMSCDT